VALAPKAGWVGTFDWRSGVGNFQYPPDTPFSNNVNRIHDGDDLEIEITRNVLF